MYNIKNIYIIVNKRFILYLICFVLFDEKKKYSQWSHLIDS